MASPDEGEAQPARPLDAERARLRAAGLTDDEISKIFIARELGAQQSQPGPGAAPGAPATGVMSGVLNNLTAVMAHARGFIPAISAQVLTVFDRSASARARLAAFLALAVKLAIVLVLGYGVYQEWEQHIIAATQIANANIAKARAEACSARSKAIVDTTPIGELNAAYAQLAKDCDPTYAARHAQEEAAAKEHAQACEVKFKSVLAVVATLDFKEKQPLDSIKRAFDDYKADCTITDAQREAANAAFAARNQKVNKLIAALNAAKPEIDAADKLDAAFKAGDYAGAYAAAQEYESLVEADEIKKNGKAGKVTASALATLSYHALFVRKFSDALAAADRSIALDPTDLVPVTNRAHALMFLGRQEEAKAVYLAHKGETVQKGQTWDKAIVDDFVLLRKAGITDPMMDEIATALTGSPVPQPVAAPAPEPAEKIETSAAEPTPQPTPQGHGSLGGELSSDPPPGDGHGVLIAWLAADGAALAAGLRVGDVILSVDGTFVNDNQTIINLISSHAPGTDVTLRVSRDGEEFEKTVTLGERPALLDEDLVVNTVELKLRSCPEFSSECAEVARMPQGAHVRPVGDAGDGWLRLYYKDQDGNWHVGFANGKYLAVASGGQ